MKNETEEPETVEFKSFFKTVKSGEGDRCHYPTRLDTFGKGCHHDCDYCYAKSLLDFRKMWDPEHPAVADIKKIRRLIANKLKPGDVVRMGGMTDCFQPAEVQEEVTFKTIEALNQKEVHYLIVTKSDLIATKKYLNIIDMDLAHIQISVSSIYDKVAARIEKAVPPSRRIKAVEVLQDHGFDVALRVSPLVPHDDYFNEVIADTIKRTRIQKILVEFLRMNHWIEKWFPEVDQSLFTVKTGGYKHLPLETKLAYLEMLECDKVVSVCEDVPEHYEHFKEFYNPNPEDCCNLDL